jgi:hypothetical protein
MRSKRQKTTFGDALMDYLAAKRLNLTELYNLLIESDYVITQSAISKYIYDERKVPGDFVHRVAVCLELNENEEFELVSAVFADSILHFFDNYTVKKKPRELLEYILESLETACCLGSRYGIDRFNDDLPDLIENYERLANSFLEIGMVSAYDRFIEVSAKFKKLRQDILDK